MIVPAQRLPVSRAQCHTVHVSGDSDAVSTAVQMLSSNGWQATAAIRVDDALWRLVVRRR